MEILLISSLLFLLFILFRIPDHTLWPVISFTLKIQSKFKGMLYSLSWVPLSWRYNYLISEIGSVRESISLGKNIGIKNELEYKFFTPILDLIIDSILKFGTPAKYPLQTLKKFVHKDYEYEQKLAQITLGAYGQMVVMAFVTWGFVYFSSKIIPAQNSETFYLMALLQSVGMFFLWMMVTIFKKKILGRYQPLFYTLLSAHVLNMAKLDFHTLVKLSHLSALFEQKLGHFEHFLERIFHKGQKNGLDISEDLDDLIQEIWFDYELKLKSFQKKIELLKFLILALFFLSSYLLYLFSFFSSFLTV